MEEKTTINQEVIDEYLAKLNKEIEEEYDDEEEFEDEPYEIFFNEQEEIHAEFEQALQELELTIIPVSGICYIITMFNIYLAYFTPAKQLSEITKEISTGKFIQWFHKKVTVSKKSDYELKEAIKVYFKFLVNKKGLLDKKALNWFK